MFEQAAVAVQNKLEFAEFQARIDKAFDPRDVEVLLSRVARAKSRIRDFEAVMSRGFLGKDAVSLYGALPVSDRALTRERYFGLVERVEPELRQRYFRIYASY
jgi:hypothetical protein